MPVCLLAWGGQPTAYFTRVFGSHEYPAQIRTPLLGTVLELHHAPAGKCALGAMAGKVASAWLLSQNERRAAERLARGAVRRVPREGNGRALARAAWSQRRSCQRRLERLRKERRPRVQGKRRLWGKGPAPLYYRINSGRKVNYAPAGGLPDVVPEISPSSACSHEPCVGSPEGDHSLRVGSLVSPVEGVFEEECFTPSLMAFLDADMDLQTMRRSWNDEHCMFRSLVSAAGVRV